MYAEDDLLPLSALQHLAFCERQCALIHIEHIWNENRLTAEGRIMHEKVHDQGHESRARRRQSSGRELPRGDAEESREEGDECHAGFAGDAPGAGHQARAKARAHGAGGARCARVHRVM